ncbi:MAG: anaerobic ribonucleoside-triphosphate reductase activating protein [Ruminococcaceae bacterium]|nr:anaerobic ribonucleoside-triphosphate reductase activating protein [Oscillospiraceae bacterium]
MNICGLQKLTLLDFPGHTACTVFTGGCNLRCPFCHNASLVKGGAEKLAEGELWGFLKKRAGLLDGVCISGGEPLLQQDIGDFIAELKKLGYKVKLDTNGTLPQHLVVLLEKGLLDYVAMDLKNSPELYPKTVGKADFDFESVAESMELLRTNRVPYEYRTTLVKPLHSKESLMSLAALIRPDEHWFLQQYIDSGDILGSGMEAFTPEEMKAFLLELQPLLPMCSLRGL